MDLRRTHNTFVAPSRFVDPHVFNPLEMSSSYLNAINVPSTTLSGPSAGVPVPVGTFTLDAGATLTDNHRVVADGGITWDGSDQAAIGAGTALTNISVRVDVVPQAPGRTYTHVVYLMPEAGFHSIYGDDVAMDIGVSATDGTTELLNLFTASSFTLGSDITMTSAYDTVSSARGVAGASVSAVADRRFTLYPGVDLEETVDADSWYVVGNLTLTGFATDLTVYIDEPDGTMTNMLHAVVGGYDDIESFDTFAANASGSSIEIRALKSAADSVAGGLDDVDGRGSTTTITVNVVDGSGSTWSTNFEFTVSKPPTVVYTAGTADAVGADAANGYETAGTDAEDTPIGSAAVSSSLSGTHLSSATVGYSSADSTFNVNAVTGAVTADSTLAASSETLRTLDAADIVWTENGRSFELTAGTTFYKYNPLVVTAVNIVYGQPWAYATFTDDVVADGSADVVMANKTTEAHQEQFQLEITFQYGLGDATVSIDSIADQANSGFQLDDPDVTALLTGASIDSNPGTTVAVGSDTSTTVTASDAGGILSLNTAFDTAPGTTEYYQVLVTAAIGNGAQALTPTAEEIYRVYAPVTDSNSPTATVFANAAIAEDEVVLPLRFLFTGGIWRDAGANSPSLTVAGRSGADALDADTGSTVVRRTANAPSITAREIYDINLVDLAGSGSASSYRFIDVTVEWYTVPTVSLADPTDAYDFGNGILLVGGVSGTEDGGILFDESTASMDWSLAAASDHNRLTISGGTALWTGNSGDGDVRADDDFIAAVYNEADDAVATGVTVVLSGTTSTSVASEAVTVTVSSDTLARANERYNLRLGYSQGPTVGDTAWIASADDTIALGDDGALWASSSTSYPLLISTAQLSISSNSGTYDADWIGTGGPLINTVATGTAQALGDGLNVTGAEDNETVLSNNGSAAVGVTGVTDDDTYVLALLDRETNDQYSGTTGSPGTLAQHFSFVKADGTLLGRTLTVDTTDGASTHTSEWNSASFIGIADIAGVVTVDDADANGALSAIQFVSDTHDAAMVLFTSRDTTKPSLAGNVSNAFIVPMVAVTSIVLTGGSLTVDDDNEANLGPDLIRFDATISQGEGSQVTDLAAASTYTHANNVTDITVDNNIIWKLCLKDGTTAIHEDFDFSSTATNLSLLTQSMLCLPTYTDDDDATVATGIDAAFAGGFPERNYSDLTTMINDTTFTSSTWQGYDLLVQTSGGFDASANSGAGNWVTVTGTSARTTASAEHQFQDYAKLNPGATAVVGSVYRTAVADSGDAIMAAMEVRTLTLAGNTRFSFAYGNSFD